MKTYEEGGFQYFTIVVEAPSLDQIGNYELYLEFGLVEYDVP